MTRSKGFTLVELLVVIGIIGSLIALLLPALARVQTQAAITRCAGNVRQLTFAWLSYANDHRGWLVSSMTNDASGWARSDLPEGYDALAQGQLWRYLKSAGVFRCPAEPRGEYARSYSIPDTLAGQNFFGIESKRTIGQVRLASQQMVFIEEFDLRGANLNSFVIDPVDLAWIDPPCSWHGRRFSFGTNLGFADGSVRFYRYQDLRTLSVEFDANYSRLPQADNVDLQELARMVLPRRG